ncbi:MAG: GNAT family N-acetyltransferase [Oscillospiraceae bacterium]|nr:GNAT family N-acetyltransferase [Oscillospiraceae bacterium]
MERKTLFTWRNDAGEIVALTAKVDNGPYSRITSVYTLPGHRRKGYAIHLVHKVTETILADGLVPTLYTDANYRASNACYRKIGYQEVGNLIKAGK